MCGDSRIIVVLKNKTIFLHGKELGKKMFAVLISGWDTVQLAFHPSVFPHFCLMGLYHFYEIPIN